MVECSTMKLADYLYEHRISIGAFAAKLEVTHETVRRYTLGLRRPTWEILEKIRDHTDGAVSYEDFKDAPIRERVAWSRNMMPPDDPASPQPEPEASAA
jgi:transcriptional regulator with XRE-family HTH domain